MYTKTFHAPRTGHTLFVEAIDAGELPAHLEETENFTKFYRVRNWDAEGVVFFYLGKGLPSAPGQVCGWFRHSGKFWSSYGNNIQEAVDGMQHDGWMYA
jgi:hypothetical protein